MKKRLVFSTKDNCIPDEYLESKLFSTECYEGMHIYDTKTGGAAILQRSDRITPMPWCLFSGICSSVFFRTYKEAKEYCESRGYSLVKEGGK